MKVDNRIVFGVSVLAVAAVFLWGRSCGVKSVIVRAGRSDTLWLKPDSVRVEVPVEKLKPFAVLVKGKDGAIIRDTQFIEKPFPTDTLGIIADYFRTYAYSYTEKIGSALISVEDTISQNMFMGRSVSAIFDSVPVVTHNNIITPPKKFVLYGTGSVMGNKQDPLHGAAAGFALKFPDDFIIGAELKVIRKVEQSKYGVLFVEAKAMFPLGKKK